MRLPETFLDQAIFKAAAAYQLRDAADQTVERDPIMGLACSWAYDMIVAECNREFHREFRTEIYPEVTHPFALKHMPLDTASPIRVWVNEVELSATDFKVEFGRLVFPSYLEGAEPDLFPLYTHSKYSYPEPLEVIVQYTGGHALAEDDQRLLTALVLQTIANYNRRDKFGLTTVTSTQGMTQVPDSTVGLIAAVKDMLPPLTYNGTGGPMV